MSKLSRRSTQSTVWLITFADIISLMLTFFVMLYAMSSVQVGRWREAADALSRQRSPSDARVTGAPTAQYNIATVFRRRAINLEYLHAVIAEAMAKETATRTLPLRLAGDRLVIPLSGVFAADGVQPNEAGEKILFTLAGLLANFTNPVMAIGHTGAQPPAGRAYTSNWEFSIGRAAAFANALRQAGYPGEVSAHGVAAPHGAEAMDASVTAADRVDIVILSGTGGV